MRNLQSFENFISIYEQQSNDTDDWRKNMGDIQGLTKNVSEKSKQISWKLAKGDDVIWKAIIREKDGDAQVILETTNSKVFDLLSKIYKDLASSLKPVTVKAEEFQTQDFTNAKSVKDSSSKKMAFGTINIPVKNVDKAFDELKKVVEKYPDSSKA